MVSDSEGLGAELQADRDALALVLSAIAGAGQDPNKGRKCSAAARWTLIRGFTSSN